MKKKEVLTFRDLHLILRNHMTVTQYEFYNELFNWAYPDGGVPEAYVSRWCNGRKSVSEVISGPAAKEPEEFNRYRVLWKKLLERKYIRCSDALMDALRNAIKKDAFQKKKRLPKAEHEVLAWALIQALENDYIKDNVPIDPALLGAFQQADKFCREANIPLNAPYILNILLETPHSPLLQALNKLRPGFGGQYSGSMKKYVERANHSGRYEGWEVIQSEFLFYAQKTVFLRKEEGKTVEEIDIVEGLLMSSSNTVDTLVQHAGGREKLLAALSPINITSDIPC